MALYLPALPTLTHFFHASTQSLILSLSIATIGYAAGQLVWGSLSDRIGRRPVYLIALSLYIIFCLLILNTTVLSTFYINMALLGFSAATFTCVGNAYIVDILGNKKSQVGLTYISITMSAAAVINPLIGSYLLTWFDWHAIYVLLLIYGVVMLLGTLLFVPETHKNRSQETKNLFKVYKTLLTHTRYMSYLFALGMAFGCFFTYLATAPFIYHHIFHATTKQYGWLFLASSITYLLGSIYVRLRIKERGHDYLLLRGFYSALLGGLLLLLMNAFHLTNLYSITLPIAIILLGLSMIIATTKVGAMTIFENNKGTAAALMKFMQIALTTAITAIAAWIHISKDINILSLFFIISVGVGLAAIRFFVLSNKKKLNSTFTTKP